MYSLRPHVGILVGLLFVAALSTTLADTNPDPQMAAAAQTQNPKPSKCIPDPKLKEKGLCCGYVSGKKVYGKCLTQVVGNGTQFIPPSDSEFQRGQEKMAEQKAQFEAREAARQKMIADTQARYNRLGEVKVTPPEPGYQAPQRPPVQVNPLPGYEPNGTYTDMQRTQPRVYPPPPVAAWAARAGVFLCVLAFCSTPAY